MITKINELKSYIKNHNCNIYIPIVIGNELLQDGNRRKLEKQYIRLNLFPNMENESIFAIGINTGYILFKLKKMNTGSICTGIDNDPKILWIAKQVKKIKGIDVKLHNLNFNKMNIDMMGHFDNILYLCVAAYLDILNVLPKLLKIANKRVIIEPTNHEQKTKKQIQEWVKIELREKVDECGYNDAKIKLLGFTDYQNRGLIQISKRGL